MAALSVQISRRLGRAFELTASFTVPPGVTAVCGASGAGKTTLLNCVAGLLKPDSGRIALGDRVWFNAAEGRNLLPQQRRVGYVFQSLALFPHLTAAENVEYGLFTVPPIERRAFAADMLSRMRIAHLADRKPAQLSGGEAQRVAIARALAPAPELLLLDEPLSGLDQQNRARLLQDLAHWLAEHPVPVLYVTHDPAELASLTARALVLERGILSPAPLAGLRPYPSTPA